MVHTVRPVQVCTAVVKCVNHLVRQRFRHLFVASDAILAQQDLQQGGASDGSVARN
jgi:hypothetical protein